MMKNILFFSICVVLGCSREPIRPSENLSWDAALDTLEILWKDTTGFNLARSFAVIGYNDQVISSRNLSYDRSFLIAHDKVTGQRLWSSEVLNRPFFGNERDRHLHENGLLINVANERLVRLSLENGEEVWTSEYSCTSAAYLLNSHYLTSSQLSNDAVQVLSTNANTGQTRQLLEIPKDGNRVPEIRTFGGYTDLNGDEIVLIGVSYASGQYGVDFATRLYSYNLSTEALEWSTGDLDTNRVYGNLLNSANSLKVDQVNGLVYVIESKHVFAVDLESGTTVWHRFFQDTNMLTSNSILYNGNLIWVDDLGHIISIEGSTGQITFRKYIGDGAPSQLIVWNNKALIANGSLTLVSLTNGEVQSKGYIEMSGTSQWFSPPFIDDSTSKIYIVNGQAIICAKIPDSWKG